MKKEELFNQVITENKVRIERICRYYAPNEEDRKDIQQEILVNIWKSLGNFKGNASMNTWIYRVAVNTALTHSGKAFKHMKLIVTRDNENLHVLMDDDGVKEKKLLESKFESLQNELNMMSIIDKALISLLLEGLNMREIADIIGITEPNVKVKIHRIKSLLKQKLNENNHENQ